MQMHGSVTTFLWKWPQSPQTFTSSNYYEHKHFYLPKAITRRHSVIYSVNAPLLVLEIMLQNSIATSFSRDFQASVEVSSKFLMRNEKHCLLAYNTALEHSKSSVKSLLIFQSLTENYFSLVLINKKQWTFTNINILLEEIQRFNSSNWIWRLK